MPDIVQNVIVDFQVDYSQLQGAQEQLAKSGKIDDKGFKAIQAAIDTTATDSKGLIKTFKEVATASTKMGKSVEDAFASGITDALDEAGVSVDQFNSALKKANAPAITLKKELQQLKERMAQLKAAGQDTGKEFDALRRRAGQLSDAIADTNQEIKNAGSDTRGLDNVVGSISAVAGGFAAVQGAAALFGDENEDLQKTLVKVNAAMALSTGLQQAFTAVQKEGSLAKLADTAITGVQTAATSLYTFVTTGATVAARAFRIALLATGVGAIVVVILALADAMGGFAAKTETAAEAQQRLADATNNLNKALKEQVDFANDVNDLNVLRAKAAGKTEKEITAIERKAITDRIALRQRAIDQAIASGLSISEIAEQQNADITALQKFDLEAQIKRNKANEERAKKVKDALEKAKQQELGAIKETVIANLEKVQKQIEQEQIGFDNQQELNKEKVEKEKALADEFARLDKERQASFVKSSEDAAAAIIAAEEKKRAAMIKTAETLIEVGNRVAGIFAALAALQTERDNQFIQGKRKEVDEQLKAGVTTQKAAEARIKQIDQFERAAKRKAAERDKQSAVFTALLAIPQAFLAGLKTSLPLAIIMGALAAAQAAIVIARPIPKFFRGKKDSYEGPAQVADMGSEIVERKGRMYLYTKPTETYLGARDKVYTAAETRKMLHNTNLETTIHQQPAAERFDYDRFARAIPAAGLNINIDKDGITHWTTSELARKTYLDRRYSSK